MIAIVFIVVIGVLIAGASLFGVQGNAVAVASAGVPWWALAAVLLAFVGFFAGGIYVGAALAVLVETFDVIQSDHWVPGSGFRVQECGAGCQMLSARAGGSTRHRAPSTAPGTRNPEPSSTCCRIAPSL